MVYIWAKHAATAARSEFVLVAASPAPPVNSQRPEASPEPVPFAREMPRLALRYSPDRRFLADGKDAATVQAFLVPDRRTDPAIFASTSLTAAALCSPLR